MSVIQRLPRPRSILLGLLMIALLSAVGCGYSEPIQGIVTLNGQPVTAGTVFFTTEGAVYSAPIQPDGTYSIDSLPPNSFTVTVFNPQAPLIGVIPAQYADPNTSGLSLDLSQNTSPVTYNIALTN